MTVLMALHARDDIYRLNMSKKGGRGLASIEDCVDLSIQGVKGYTERCKEELISAANNNRGNRNTNRKTTKKEKNGGKETNI